MSAPPMEMAFSLDGRTTRSGEGLHAIRAAVFHFNSCAHFGEYFQEGGTGGIEPHTREADCATGNDRAGNQEEGCS